MRVSLNSPGTLCSPKHQNEKRASTCTFHGMVTCVLNGYFELGWVSDCHLEVISYVI